MKNKFIFYSKNVTNYVFSQDFEILYHNDKQLPLSKGAKERNHPLPVINAIAEEFISLLMSDSDPYILFTQKDPTNTILPNMIKKIESKLNLDLPFMDSTSSKGSIAELISLIISTFDFAPGNRRINSRIMALGSNYNINSFVRAEIQEERTKSLSFTPIRISEGNHFFEDYKVVDDKVKDDQVEDDKVGTDPNFYLTLSSNPEDLVSIAWLELTFAQMFKSPFSICTFCGQTYCLDSDKAGRGGNFRKNNCGKESCKKLSRSQSDHLRRIKSLEKEREKDNFRKQKSRKKEKALEMNKHGTKLRDIACELNISEIELKKWIKEKENE